MVRPNDRRERIEQVVRARERVTVDALAELLGTSRKRSAATSPIWLSVAVYGRFTAARRWPSRDLRRDVEGSFQGGFWKMPTPSVPLPGAPVQLFQPGDTLFVDTGTTTLWFAEELSSATGLDRHHQLRGHCCARVARTFERDIPDRRRVSRRRHGKSGASCYRADRTFSTRHTPS